MPLVLEVLTLSAASGGPPTPIGSNSDSKSMARLMATLEIFTVNAHDQAEMDGVRQEGWFPSCALKDESYVKDSSLRRTRQFRMVALGEVPDRIYRCSGLSHTWCSVGHCLGEMSVAFGNFFDNQGSTTLV